MSNQIHPMVQLLEQDQRYKLEAYQFVSEALVYAQEVMRLHEQKSPETAQVDPIAEVDEYAEFAEEVIDEDDFDEQDFSDDDFDEDEFPEEYMAREDDLEDEEVAPEKQSHITGQQLCEAIRQYALDQYGYLAKTVLNNWGVTATSDFGEIVYNLIRIKQMRKSDSDRREDFDNVYDFATAFAPKFEIASYRP